MQRGTFSFSFYEEVYGILLDMIDGGESKSLYRWERTKNVVFCNIAPYYNAA